MALAFLFSDWSPEDCWRAKSSSNNFPVCDIIPVGGKTMARSSKELPILVAQTGPLSGQRWAVETTLVVGREPGCEIMIQNREVSRYHARFTWTAEGVTLEDLGSKNGTHINGKPIAESTLLQDGDIIQIALTQQFLYLGSDATATIPLDGGEIEQFVQPISGRLKLDKRSRRVWIGDEEVLPPLSVSQFHLLDILYDRQGRVVERQELITSVWGDKEALGVSEQALDALIRRLRDRLAATDPTHPYIITMRGHGVRLENPPV
jgi:pSer/pThr/pTyr-binding forkhead associated (FHA) protein